MVDSQSVEIIGRNLLVSEFVRDGVEVARPERDRGVDLIAYWADSRLICHDWRSSVMSVPGTPVAVVRRAISLRYR